MGNYGANWENFQQSAAAAATTGSGALTDAKKKPLSEQVKELEEQLAHAKKMEKHARLETMIERYYNKVQEKVLTTYPFFHYEYPETQVERDKTLGEFIKEHEERKRQEDQEITVEGLKKVVSNLQKQNLSLERDVQVLRKNNEQGASTIKILRDCNRRQGETIRSKNSVIDYLKHAIRHKNSVIDHLRKKTGRLLKELDTAYMNLAEYRRK